MVPLALLLGVAIWQLEFDREEAVPRSVAAVVSLVPEGLILLTSLTYAVAAIRMARRGALAQQLNAVESLAAVDVVCLDKTGTLTEGTLRVVELVPLDPGFPSSPRPSPLRGELPSRNATLEAIADSRAAPPVEVDAHVAFASRRGWSALRLQGRSYVLGAPELFPLGPLAGRAAKEAEGGRRVLAFGTATDPLCQEDPVAAPRGSRRSASSSWPSSSARMRARPSTSSAHRHRVEGDLGRRAGHGCSYRDGRRHRAVDAGRRAQAARE